MKVKKLLDKLTKEPFEIGMRVEHPKFGKGTIIDIKNYADPYAAGDRGIVVEFDPIEPNKKLRSGSPRYSKIILESSNKLTIIKKQKSSLIPKIEQLYIPEINSIIYIVDQYFTTEQQEELLTDFRILYNEVKKILKIILNNRIEDFYEEINRYVTLRSNFVFKYRMIDNKENKNVAIDILKKIDYIFLQNFYSSISFAEDSKMKILLENLEYITNFEGFISQEILISDININKKNINKEDINKKAKEVINHKKIDEILKKEILDESDKELLNKYITS